VYFPHECVARRRVDYPLKCRSRRAAQGPDHPAYVAYARLRPPRLCPSIPRCPHLPASVCVCLCAPVSVPPPRGGWSRVVVCGIYVRIGRTQWHARPLVCPPHPPLIPPTHPLLSLTPTPLSPSCLSLPLWPLPLHTRLVCPAVVHRPTSPLSACACLRVCCAARYGFHLCGRVTAGLTPGCVGVTRREGPPVSKPPLSLPLPRVVPPLRRPTPPYPTLCTPPHTPLSGHRLGLS